MDLFFETDKEDILSLIWIAEPTIGRILRRNVSVHDLREDIFEHLNSTERSLFNIYSERRLKDVHIVERNNAKQCIRVLKNIMRTENERITGFSALRLLHDLALQKVGTEDVSTGFLLELYFLFMGMHCRSKMNRSDIHLKEDDPGSAASRSAILDGYSSIMDQQMRRYRSGTDPPLIKRARRMRDRILSYFGASKRDWTDTKWQLTYIIRDLDTLEGLVSLSDDEKEGLMSAEAAHIPFQITPYYLSLFDPKGRSESDRAVRAQVLPSKMYCETVAKKNESGEEMDFMGERSTSPVECVTRRYPKIVILKPFGSCPQICVYCQRNWEIKRLDDGDVTPASVEKAIDWISDNRSISEVLVTGGDPLTLNNGQVRHIMERLYDIRHVERVRIGTRVFVTLPFRIDRELVVTLKKGHVPGHREVCLITHYEHPSEVTPDSIAAVTRVRDAGMSVYNQQVFTYYNSRRFETCALRRTLKLCGVDPYYSFNTKGKEETDDFRVPIARILQERKEEARLLPGVVRTDEPVFNVPRLGKVHLRAWQDHEPIMILPTGQRVYRFYPWESGMSLVDDYIYTDVSIWDYLTRLHNEGESTSSYRSIWYYF